MLIFGSFSAHAVVVDATPSGNWLGYMSWFDKNVDGTKGGYLNGTTWGIENLSASYVDDTITLSPNTNAYRDMADDAGRAYWSNSPDGGITAGPDGNKWMEASYFLEAAGDNTAWNGQSLTFSGTISDFSLDARYSTVAFIKTLDIDNGYATIQNTEESISSTGEFELSLDILEGNYIAQMGFTMSGINANPDTDWGNVELTDLEATAVPEASTYALLAGFAAFLFVAIRQRK